MPPPKGPVLLPEMVLLVTDSVPKHSMAPPQSAEVLLARVESAVPVEAVAVFDRLAAVVLPLTLTTRVKVAVAPAGRVAVVAPTLPDEGED